MPREYPASGKVLDSLGQVVDEMRKAIPKDDQEALQRMTGEIDHFHSAVGHKVSEIYSNILNNFDRPSLNALHGEQAEDESHQRSLGQLRNNVIKGIAGHKNTKGKENLLELVSKKLKVGHLKQQKRVPAMVPTINKLKTLKQIQKSPAQINQQLVRQSTINTLDNFQFQFTKVSENTVDKVSAKVIQETKFHVLNGKFKDTPESIGHVCGLENAQKIQLTVLMRTIQEFCRSCNIQRAVLSESKLKALLRRDQIPTPNLLNAFDNKSDIERTHKACQRVYWGNDGRLLAIVKVQSLVRMFIQRRRFRNLLLKNIEATKVQKWWQSCRRLAQTRGRIKQSNLDHLRDFNCMQDKFRKDWDGIKFQRRVQVHVSSWGCDKIKRLKTQKFKQKQNCEVTRIFRVSDSNLTVIYVSAVQFSPELISYYNKILLLTETSPQSQRVFFVSPQTLAQSLCYSDQCLDRIRNIVGSRFAYIVPGQCSMDYTKIAMKLKIPVYGNPNQGRYLSLKSSIGSILNGASRIPQCRDVYQFQTMVQELGLLIYSNPAVTRWYFKVDDDTLGRGNAYIQTNSFRELRQVQSMKPLNSQHFMTNYITIVLRDKLRYKLKWVYPDLYKSYQQFMQTFLSKGGCIQASTNTSQSNNNLSLSIQIQPDREWNIFGTYQKVIVHDKTVGYEFVQQVLVKSQIKDIVQKITDKFNYFGFLSLDFFKVQEEYQLVGIDPFLNRASSAYFMAHNFTKTPDTLFVYCPMIVHPGVKDLELKTFFHFCRLQGISFDISKRSGSIFLFVDSLQSECLGLISISQSRKQVLNYMVDAFQFLHKKGLNKQPNCILNSTNDEISLEAIAHKLRMMYKKTETKPASSLRNLLPIR